MQYVKPLLAVGAAIAALLYMLSGDAIERPPGELAPDVPEQSLLESARPIQVGDFTLQPRATYRIVARVLGTERYRTDAGASLAPIDFALGWGPMSDSSALDHFRLSQGSRFFTIYPDEKAIDLTIALRSAANVHLIPANGAVRKMLFSTRVGHVVELRGFLVSASRDDGFAWNTSLTRDDTGNGACELFYVEAVTRR